MDLVYKSIIKRNMITMERMFGAYRGPASTSGIMLPLVLDNKWLSYCCLKSTDLRIPYYKG